MTNEKLLKNVTLAVHSQMWCSLVNDHVRLLERATCVPCFHMPIFKWTQKFGTRVYHHVASDSSIVSSHFGLKKNQKFNPQTQKHGTICEASTKTTI